MKRATRSSIAPEDMPVQQATARARMPSDLEEILDFPAKYLIALPVSTVLTIGIPGSEENLIWSTAAREELAELDPDTTLFDRTELAALIIAAESERSRKSDLLDWIAAKKKDSGVRIDLETAMAGAAPVADQIWSLSRVLRWYGCELVGVELVGRAPFLFASDLSKRRGETPRSNTGSRPPLLHPRRRVFSKGHLSAGSVPLLDPIGRTRGRGKRAAETSG